MLTLVNPGDEVVHRPYFVMYKHGELAGACRRGETLRRFHLDIDKVADAITPRTGLMIINSPANPTGAVYTEQQLRPC